MRTAWCRSAWAIGVAGLALVAGLAGCRGGRNERPTLVPAELELVPATLDMGCVPAGGWAERAVLVRNVTAYAVSLVGVQGPCECTTAHAEFPIELAQGGEVLLPIRVDLAKLSRGGLDAEPPPEGSRLARGVTLRLKSGETFPLPVNVLVSASLEVTPTTLDMGLVVTGSRGRGDVVVQGTSGPVSVLEAFSKDARLAANPSVDPESGRTQLALAWGPFREAGPVEAVMTILTDLETCPRVDVRVVARVEPPVWIQPDRIDVAGAAPGQPLVRRVRVGRSDGIPLEILAISCDSGRVKYRALNSGGEAWREVELVIPVAAAPWRVEGTLSIITDMPGVDPVFAPIRVTGR